MKKNKYLLFTLNENIHGINIESVNQILKFDKLTKIPLSKPEFRGVISIAGDLKTAIDLNLYLYKKETDITSFTDNLKLITILDTENCFIVENVMEIIEIDEDNIQSLVINKKECFVGKHNGNIFSIIETKKIIDSF